MNIIAENKLAAGGAFTVPVNEYTVITIISTGGSGDTLISATIAGGRSAVLPPITGGVGFVTLDGMFSTLTITPGTAAVVDVAARERR